MAAHSMFKFYFVDKAFPEEKRLYVGRSEVIPRTTRPAPCRSQNQVTPRGAQFFATILTF